MQRPYSLPFVVPLTLVVLLLPSCSDSADDSGDTTLAPTTTTAPTTTAAPTTTVAPTTTAIIGSSDEDVQLVLVIPRVNSIDVDYMLTNEVGVMLGMFEEAGVEAVVALPDGKALEGWSEVLEADLALADVVASDYAGVMLPDMAAKDEINDRTVEIVREALDLGMPVAAQRRSVYTLAVAGALEGRQYACEKPIPTWIIEDEGGGTYNGTGVVQDGNVITSGTGPYRARMTGEPDGTTELTQLFMNALG